MDLTESLIILNGQPIFLSEYSPRCGTSLVLHPDEELILELDQTLPMEIGNLALCHYSVHEYLILDQYVQWGASGQDMEEQAMERGKWATATHAPSLSPGLALHHDGSGIGAEHWSLGDAMHCALTATEAVSQSALQISPNPAVSSLKITLPSTAIMQYRIINSLGIVLKSGKLSSGQSIDLNGVSSGSYILHITERGQHWSQPFMVTR